MINVFLKNFSYSIIAILITISACKSPRYTYDLDIERLPKSSLPSKSLCLDYQSYIPDPAIDVMYKIKMRFHIIEGPGKQSNFAPAAIKDYFWLLTENANFRLLQNERMKLPINNTTKMLSPLYQYHILSEGYQYHLERDKTLAYFMNKGAEQNNYNTDIIDRYAKNTDSVLNVFVMSFPPDEMEQRSQSLHGGGIALGTSIKISGLFQKGGESWAYATLLNHEVGHVLSLSHAWHEDGCDDTPYHTNCFQDNSGDCTGSIASNNMMDYNNSQMSITPCQIGRMRATLANEANFQRKLLLFDFCNKKENQLPIVIKNKTQWLGEKDIDRDIIVKKGGSLRICCRLSLPKDGAIIVEKGGELILDHVKIHNACDYKIDGIMVHKGGKVVKIGS
jgi:hypothetical protein